MERRGDHFATTSSFPTDSGNYHYNNHFNGGRHHNFNGQQNESTGYHLNGDSNPSLALTGHKRPFPHPNNADYGGYAKLYVVGITRTATELDVGAVFGEFGEIIEVVLLKDKRVGLQQECCFVKYATVEQAERAIGAFNSQYTFPGGSFGAHVNNLKLYVGCLNRQASKLDIEEIFSPFGVIEEIFIVRDEYKQCRGCSFVQYTHRDMALAAIHALHGTFVMRGCDQPLIVRFAEPKKPRLGDSRPTPYLNYPSSVHMASNEIQQMKSSHSGSNVETMASNDTAPASRVCDSIPEIENTLECDWSEHVSLDGDLYYYNCVTCESKWEMPEEYALYEQELDNLEEQQQQWFLSSLAVSETRKV